MKNISELIHEQKFGSFGLNYALHVTFKNKTSIIVQRLYFLDLNCSIDVPKLLINLKFVRVRRVTKCETEYFTLTVTNVMSLRCESPFQETGI